MAFFTLFQKILENFMGICTSHVKSVSVPKKKKLAEQLYFKTWLTLHKQF